MKYIWDPPSDLSLLGPTRKGQVVDLEPSIAESIRATWNKSDVLVEVRDAPQPVPVPVKKPRRKRAK